MGLFSVYDPRTDGCDCDRCPLGAQLRKRGKWRPVRPALKARAESLVVLPFPSNDERVTGAWMRGRENEPIIEAFDAYEMDWRDVSVTGAILCQPVQSKLKLLLARVATRNKKIAAWNKRVRATKRERALLNKAPLEPKATIPTPEHACAGQLKRALDEHRNVLVLGKYAYKAVTGENKQIRKIRGAFLERYHEVSTCEDAHTDEHGVTEVSGHMLKIVPTFEAGFVRGRPAWMEVFRRDIERFLRWTHEALDWEDPQKLLKPTPAQLERFLFHPKIHLHAWDVETDMIGHAWVNPLGRATGKPPAVPQMRCIGFGTVKGGMCVPFRSIRPERGRGYTWLGFSGEANSYYSQADAKRIIEILRRWFLDESRKKVGHNSRYFDEGVILNELGLTVPIRGSIDTITMFRGANSEISRDLYTLGTMLLDVPDWKGADGDLAVSTRDDRELWEYNILDCVVTARCYGPLLKRVKQRDQLRSVRMDFKMQTLARDMHTLGMRVDEDARRGLEETVTERLETQSGILSDKVGRSGFNPNSTQQLATLLFDDWGLPVLSRSENTGEPSTNDATVRKLALSDAVTDDQLAFLLALRRYRSLKKELGTYIIPLRPWDDYRLTGTGNRRVGGHTGPDGRVHPEYNVHTPSTGRISASNPSTQNIKTYLKSLFIPEEGNLFVAADYDQVDLRVVCALAQVGSYLKTFREGGDPHAVTAYLIYGDTFEAELRKSYTPEQWSQYQRTGVPQKAEDHLATVMYSVLRRFAKTFVYAVIYGGTAKTIFMNVSAAEDTNGELLFPGMELRDVRAAYAAWMRNAAEIPAWWERTQLFARRHKYITEPVLGRRRDFPSYEPNEILNMPVQGGASNIVAMGATRLAQRLPRGFGGPSNPNTGIVLQCHDSLTVETPWYLVPYVQQVLNEVLRIEIPTLPGVVFSAKAGRGASNLKAAG